MLLQRPNNRQIILQQPSMLSAQAKTPINVELACDDELQRSCAPAPEAEVAKPRLPERHRKQLERGSSLVELRYGTYDALGEKHNTGHQAIVVGIRGYPILCEARSEPVNVQQGHARTRDSKLNAGT